MTKITESQLRSLIRGYLKENLYKAYMDTNPFAQAKKAEKAVEDSNVAMQTVDRLAADISGKDFERAQRSLTLLKQQINSMQGYIMFTRDRALERQDDHRKTPYTP